MLCITAMRLPNSYANKSGSREPPKVAAWDDEFLASLITPYAVHPIPLGSLPTVRPERPQVADLATPLPRLGAGLNFHRFCAEAIADFDADAVAKRQAEGLEAVGLKA